MYSAFTWTKIATNRNKISRQYEPIQPFLLIEMARVANSEIFIDIGANIGVYSIFLSDLSSISKVIAFEASPETFRELSANVLSNDPDGKVELHNLAVSNDSGPLQFGIVSDFSGANGVIDTSIHDSEKFTDTITVQSIRLDELLNFQDCKICLKIDVEGHEASVIAGAISTLKQNKCIIQVENYGSDPVVIKTLVELGFRVCFTVGPDVYLANDPTIGGPEEFLRMFEVASGAMITNNVNTHEPAIRRSYPIRRRIPGGIVLEVDGRLAWLLRKLVGKPV